MFRELPKFQTTINCLLSDGGLGDHLASLVAVNYIIKNHSYLNVLVWLPDYLIDFAKLVLPKNTSIRGYSESNKYNNSLPGITTKWDGRISPMRMHPVDYAFNVLADKTVALEDKNYLKPDLTAIDFSRFNLPEKYIAIQAYASERVKRLSGYVINDIARYCLIKGYTPVFIGSGSNKSGYKNIGTNAELSEGIDLTLGIDLTNKTNILELIKVISNSKVFIGMDGGLVHAAGCTDVPIICGYTFINPNHNLPIRNNVLGYNCYTVIPDESLKCRFCQSNMILLYNHDYRDCFYKDYECVNSLKFQQFREYIDKVL